MSSPRAFTSPHSSRPRLSLSPLSRAFSGRTPETPRSAREQNDRRARPIASTRRRRRRPIDANAREGTRKNITPPSRRPSRPSRGRVGVFFGTDRSRDGTATDRSTIFWDAIIRCADARGGVTRASTGARDSKRSGAKASVDVARAAVETRGARPETVSGARGTSASRGE